VVNRAFGANGSMICSVEKDGIEMIAGIPQAHSTTMVTVCQAFFDS
jgi:hypothetical protein